MSSETKRWTVAVDFDGVLHSYTSGWQGTMVIADDPVPGAFEWLAKVIEVFDVVVHTCRLSDDPESPFQEETPVLERIDEIQAWMLRHGCPLDVVRRLQWHTTPGKPHASVYIDDRGWRFSGTFPTVEDLQVLRPWNVPADEPPKDPEFPRLRCPKCGSDSYDFSRKVGGWRAFLIVDGELVKTDDESLRLFDAPKTVVCVDCWHRYPFKLEASS